MRITMITILVGLLGVACGELPGQVSAATVNGCKVPHGEYQIATYVMGGDCSADLTSGTNVATADTWLAYSDPSCTVTASAPDASCMRTHTVSCAWPNGDYMERDISLTWHRDAGFAYGGGSLEQNVSRHYCYGSFSLYFTAVDH